MNEQERIQTFLPVQPTTDDRAAWHAYWQQLGQAWRTEPEVDAERQQYLAERRAIVPDIERGIYPFRDIQLSRADVEWLLASHENGRGPVDWSDTSQRGREGLDLRGADLRQVNLHWLPLAGMRGGLTRDEWYDATEEQRTMAAVLMKDAYLRGTHLEGARFRCADLVKANFRQAHLEEADLGRSHLKEANLRGAHLEGADLWGAHLEGADLSGVQLRNTQLAYVKLADEKQVGPRLADAHWDDTNLAVVQWSQIEMLGDEYEARQRYRNGEVKVKATQLRHYERAVRANRQLAVAFQNLGLNEEAARFAYRAQKLQRVVLRRQKKFGQYFFSGFLDLLAGYGYRPGRTVLWYLLVIGAFAATYALFGHLPLFPDALVFSLTSFHGRGFFPGLGSETALHNPLVVLAAIEAVIGLFIEISFIATFTQRYFGR